jgi:hypothetical protein
LQGMQGLQGPTKENIPTSPFENILFSHKQNKRYTLNQEQHMLK